MDLAAAAGGGASAVLLLALLGLMVLATGVVAFWVWGIVDVFKVKDEKTLRAGNKLLWIMLMVSTGVIGTLVYACFARPYMPTPAPAAT